MPRATLLFMAACFALGTAGCSWIHVPRTVPPERPSRCADGDIPKGDIAVSAAFGIGSILSGAASAYYFFGPDYRHDDTGTGIIKGSATALAAGLMALPALLFGLSSRYGYINISTCEQQRETPVE